MQLREGLDWAARLLAADRGTDPSARLAALAGQGSLAYWSTDHVLTRRAYEERLAIAQTLDDPRQLAEAHYDLAFVGMVEQDLDFLRRESESALAHVRAAGRPPGHDPGPAGRGAGPRPRRRLRHGARHGGAEPGRLPAHAGVVPGRGQHAAAGGDLPRGRGPAAALASVRAGIRLVPGRVGGTTLGALGTIGVLLAEAGDEAEAERAARLAGAVRAAQAETGEAIPSVSVLHLPEPGDAVRERLGAERATALMADGAKLSIEEAIELALVE